MSSPLDEIETKKDPNDDIKQPVDILEEQGKFQPYFNEDSVLMYDIHVPSYEFDEYLQQTCQSFDDQRYEDSHSLVVSDFSFFGFSFQDHFFEYQYEVSNEIHEQGSLDIHHSYVSPAHKFSTTLFRG